MRPLLVLPVAVCLGVSAPAQSPTPDFSQVREYITTRMAATSTPSMAVAVARGPDVLWEEGFGWIDRPGGTAATPDTLYYVASVTKAITATALMVLHERKQLDLDRPANLYLRRAKLRSPHWNADEATVRQLATHTAGLTTFDSRAPLPAEEVVRRYGIVFWRPGDRYDYSNLGFGVIGQIIADVSGRSFQSFVHDEVLRPLDMEHAWAGARPQTEHPVAPRYSALLRAFSPPLTEPTLPGGSVLFSSVRELARFGMFHLQTRMPQRPILMAASIQGLQEPSVPSGSTRQSLAWSITENRHGYRTLLAQGGTFDSQAWLLLVPAEKIVVAVLANYGSAPAMEVIDQILSTLLPAYREGLSRAQQAPAAAPAPAAPLSVPAEFIGKWSGKIQTHRAHLPLVLTVLSTGVVDAALEKQGTVRMTDLRFSVNRMSGRMRGDLGVDDTGTAPYELRLQLQLQDKKLIGAAVTYALEGYEGPRLPFWVELKR
jgi:CubicO group peptidase (beta-lactamase class C family)